jgi:hypothetical protein
MSKNRHSTVLLECSTCGAVLNGVTCGGVLKPQEKQHKPLAEKPV